MISNFVKAWMLQDAGVKALLGEDPIHFWLNSYVPQKFRERYPRGHATIIDDRSISDDQTGAGDVWLAEVQIDFFDRGPQGYATAQQLAQATIGTPDSPKLNYFEGTLAGIQVGKVRHLQTFDLSTPPDEASDSTIQQVTQRFEIAYVRKIND